MHATTFVARRTLPLRRPSLFAVLVATLAAIMLLFFAVSLLHVFTVEDFEGELDGIARRVAAAGQRPLDPRANYLTFLPYDGGFNNRRSQLEMQAWLALLLNRTLILPSSLSTSTSASPRAAAGDGSDAALVQDLHVAHARMLEPQDVYDMALLESAIPVITAEEFERRGGLDVLAVRQRQWLASARSASLRDAESVDAPGSRRLDCDSDPRRFLASESSGVQRVSQRWLRHCREAQSKYAPMAAWLKYDLGHFYAIPFPSDEKKSFATDKADPFHDRFEAGRRPIRLPAGGVFEAIERGNEYDDSATSTLPPLLFDGQEEGFRVFGNLAVVDPSRFATKQQQAAARAKLNELLGTMRSALRYHNRALFKHAERAVALLGGGDFDAFHMRRTDYKVMFPHLVSDPASVLMRFRRVMHHGAAAAAAVAAHSNATPPRTVFIASDDDLEIQRLLAMPEHRCATEGLRIVTWTDLERMDRGLRDEIRPATLKPLVAQLLLAAGRIFVGNERSSLTSYVVRQRGYAGLQDATYFSTMGFVEEPPHKPVWFFPAMNQGIAEAPWVWQHF